MIPKKQKLYLCFMALGAFLISNCGAAVNSSLSPIASATQLMESSTPTETKTPTSTLLPTITFTLSPVPIVLPAITMSPQESEDALQELLKTNGNCTGKCLAGIHPDEMTTQEAVEQMERWGMLYVDEDNDGRTFVHAIPPTPQDKQIRINLDLLLKKETVDTVSFHIPRRGDGDGEFLGADVWLANREAWKAFQFGNLLKAYGIPSFVGFFMETYSGGSVAYTLDIQYEQMNLDIGIGGLAIWDGQGVFICPSKDPHTLGIVINPEDSLGVSLSELQQTSPITWQSLTGSDLQAFYQTFTDESNSDGCVIATMKKIMELDPTFR